MAYRRPFTLEQRREAIRAYRSYRKHCSELRRRYPPTTAQQQEVLHQYVDSIREMAVELRKADRMVDIAALNRADAWARWLAVEYRRSREQ